MLVTLTSRFFLFQAYKILQMTKTDEDMFNEMVKIIGNAQFSNDDLKIAGYSFFKKLAASTIYKPEGKVNGPVTLIRATDTFIPLEKDYGLSKVGFLRLTCVQLYLQNFPPFLSY